MLSMMVPRKAKARKAITAQLTHMVNKASSEGAAISLS
jgi:hypothetical protein